MADTKKKNNNKDNGEKKSAVHKFLNFVEKWGNKLPHPFTLFVILTAFLVLLSFIVGIAGVAVDHPTKDTVVEARNLLSGEGVQYMILNLLDNFTGFRPLGLVLGMMLGIGLAEKAGLMSAFMKKFMLGAPERLLLAAIFLIGICGNIASDAALIIVPPLAGAIFYGTNRNPLVGVAAGYAAASAGFTANLVIAGTDALLAGISEEAAMIIDPTITVSPLVNYYFMIVSTILLTIGGTWITKKFIEKQAGEYTPEEGMDINVAEFELTESENKGLRAAGITTLIYWGIIIALMIPQSSILRSDAGGIIDGT